MSSSTLSSPPAVTLIAAVSAAVVAVIVSLILQDDPDVEPPPLDGEPPSPAEEVALPEIEAVPPTPSGAPVDFMTPPEGHDVEPLGDVSFGPAKQITAFFPAQANLQWLAADVDGYEHPVAGDDTPTTHPGGALTAPCAECHTEDGVGPTPRQLGERLVDTPAGVEDKRPWTDVDLRAAFDDDYLYLQASWQSDRPRPGITHQTFQFLDGQWERNDTNKDDEIHHVDHLDDDGLFDYEDRLAVMLAPEGSDIRAFGDDGPSFDDIGCAVGCHASMRQMPNAPAADEVAAHPYLGDDGLGEDDIRHYLLHTREADDRYDADGAWASIGADYDAAGDRDDEHFLDLWQYRGARSAAMYGASNDYVMEYRFSGAGGDNYWFNQDPSEQAADAGDLVYDEDAHLWRTADGEEADVTDYAWMYDIAQTGFHALPAEAIDDDHREISAEWARHYPLVIEGPDRNALPLDEEVIGAGDLLPRRMLRYATGVRGRTHAFSRWHPLTNTYTVIFRSPLSGAESDLDARAIREGQNLTVAIAVFDDHSSNRFHHISFPITVGPGDDADLRARRVDY